MSHTNQTAHYNLPQFLGTDVPGWLTDVNAAMLALDNAIYARQQAIAANTQSITENTAAITGLTTRVTTAEDNISSMNTNLSDAETDIDNLQALTGEHTTQISSLANTITNLDAADIAYDGTTSGLAANNVQAAADELAANISAVLPVITGLANAAGVITMGDMLIEYGMVNVTSPANGVGSAMVTFTNPFEMKPAVLLTADTTSPGTTVKMVAVADLEVDSFKAYCSRTNTTPTSIQWIAIGKKASV